MTKLLYLDDSYIFESKATITGKMVDEKGPYILLDQTIFYPQGGGQPSDQGIIQGDGFQLEITFVRQFEDKIFHYLNKDFDKFAYMIYSAEKEGLDA